MNISRWSRVLAALTVVGVLSVGSVSWASITSMTVDEILFQPPAGAYTQTLSGTVRMNIVSDMSMWFLLVELTNTSTQVPNTDDSTVILTGVGFQLPTGFSINSDMSSNLISLLLIDGSGSASTKVGLGADITNDNWGFGNATGGHFDDDPANLPYSTVISTFTSDVTTDKTLIGTALTGGMGPTSMGVLIDQFDYGIKSALTGSFDGPKPPVYQDHLTFKVKLVTPVSFVVDDVLALIDGGSVGLAYGSPSTTNRPPITGAIPEAASVIVWSLLMGSFALAGVRRRATSAA